MTDGQAGKRATESVDAREVVTVCWNLDGSSVSVRYTVAHLLGPHESGSSFLVWLLKSLDGDGCSEVTVSLG